MKFNLAIVLSLSTLMVSACAFAAPTIQSATAASPKGPFTCPVTGDKIASVKDAVGHSTYKGKTYYFCCDECKPQFDANPAKYVKSASAPAAKKTVVSKKAAG